jgi:energy-coupling factor transporter ATP-binding protein EcfA2
MPRPTEQKAAAPSKTRAPSAPDANDLHRAGVDLAGLLDSAGPMDAAPAPDSPAASNTAGGRRELWEIAQEAEVFFCPADGERYARVSVAAGTNTPAHRQTLPLRGQELRRWLIRRHVEKFGEPPPADAVAWAIGGIDAADAEPASVWVRVAPDGADGIYVDLGDSTWRAVHVTATGWKVTTASPVLFRRPNSLRPLPKPIPGGSVGELRTLIALQGEADWALVVAWLVAALYPAGPYPIAVLTGPPGAGKSTTARMLRGLVDPASPELRQVTRDPRDLAAAARNSRVLALDNLSGMQPWLADALCCLATGTAWASRALFTDTDESVVAGAHPMILTGIETPSARADLLDRAAAAVELARLDDPLPESELFARYEEARPRLLGALLDRLAGALRELPNVAPVPRVRMQDFVRLARAAEIGAGEAPRIIDALAAVRDAGADTAIDGHPVGVALRALVAAKRRKSAPGEEIWSGTAGELLDALRRDAGLGEQFPRGWPDSPRGMSSALARLGPALREALGVTVEGGAREGHGRRRVLRLVACAGVAQ